MKTSLFLLVAMLHASALANESGADTGGKTLRGLSGEQLFTACASCHSLQAGAPHRVGPNLHGLAGQSAGSQPGFTYSSALKHSGIVWDEGSLLAFILESGRLVPGTWMVYHNVLTAEESQRLARYVIDSSTARQ
jgi:cytochrome c